MKLKKNDKDWIEKNWVEEDDDIEEPVVTELNEEEQ